MEKKNNRVLSPLNRDNRQKIIKDIYKKNTSKIQNFRNISKKLNFSNTSMYCTSSRYLSFHENNLSNNYSKSKHIINSKSLHNSNSVDLRLNSNNPATKTIKRKNIFNLSNKISVPKYDHDKLFLSKNFRKKFTFLEHQFDKEISFHKNLLKIKYIKEDLVKQNAPNSKELYEEAKRFFYSNYYNELMNAQEKQIIFDKKEDRKKSKLKTKRRYENSEAKSFISLNLSNNLRLDNEDINENNNNYIKKLRKKILEINDKKVCIKKIKKILC